MFTLLLTGRWASSDLPLIHTCQFPSAVCVSLLTSSWLLAECKNTGTTTSPHLPAGSWGCWKVEEVSYVDADNSDVVTPWGCFK